MLTVEKNRSEDLNTVQKFCAADGETFYPKVSDRANIIGSIP